MSITEILTIASAIATVVGLLATFVRVVSFTTKVDIYVQELRSERKYVKTIPVMTYRIGALEKHLDISTPELPNFTNGEEKS